MSPLCVLATSRVPPGVRGALNQWMIEILPGVYVGRPSARVRGHLWEALVEAFEFEEDSPYAALIHQSEHEQGFTIERIGQHRYEVADFDGLQLVTVKHRPAQADDQFQGLPDPSWWHDKPGARMQIHFYRCWHRVSLLLN